MKFAAKGFYFGNMESLPSRERGLKLDVDEFHDGRYGVAPLAGAWIEIIHSPPYKNSITSLPSRERGLKSGMATAKRIIREVAPLAGAWIEILQSRKKSSRARVAPLAGAWIEIRNRAVDTAESGGRSPRGSVD